MQILLSLTLNLDGGNMRVDTFSLGLGPMGLIVVLIIAVLFCRVLFGKHKRPFLAAIAILSLITLSAVSSLKLWRSRVSDSDFFAGRGERIRVTYRTPRIPQITLGPKLPGPAKDLIPAVALADAATLQSTQAAATGGEAADTRPVAEITGRIPVELDDAVANVPLPGWVDNPAGNEMSATVGPYATREECQREMSREIQRKAKAYVDILMGHEGAGDLVELPLSYIQDNLLQRDEQVFQPVQSSVGPMFKLHARLKFSEQANREIRQRYQEKLRAAEMAHRVGQAGAWSGLLLTLLATLWGYLKLDTATKGYYSGRLKLAAGTVILAVGAAGFLLAQRYLAV